MRRRRRDIRKGMTQTILATTLRVIRMPPKVIQVQVTGPSK